MRPVTLRSGVRIPSTKYSDNSPPEGRYSQSSLALGFSRRSIKPMSTAQECFRSKDSGKTATFAPPA